MLPFCSSNALLSIINNRSREPESQDADYDWYLKNEAVQPRESFLMRLLPTAMRKRLKDRRAAQQYEQTLIELWEKSPHLLQDIGVVALPEGPLDEHLCAAPEKVAEHVKASLAERKAAALALRVQEQATVTPVPTPAPARPAFPMGEPVLVPATSRRVHRSRAGMPAGRSA